MLIQIKRAWGAGQGRSLRFFSLSASAGSQRKKLKKVAEHQLAPKSVPQPPPSASRMMAISDSEKTAELLFRFSAQKSLVSTHNL